MKLILPDEVIKKTGFTDTDLIEILAVSLYQMNKINGVQGGKITGQSEIEFHNLLGKYGQYIQYDETDLLKDFDSIKNRERAMALKNGD